MRIPNSPSRGDVITADHMRAISDAIRDLYAKLSEVSNNRYRPILGAGGGGLSTCYFGEIITWTVGETTKTGIRGGTIQAGIKNFNVPNKELNLASTGVTLIYLEISVTANRDDANEILLPGLETSTETTPSGFWKSVSWTAEPLTQYPANTRPLVTTGVGKIIIPIGKLTIAAGAASLEAVQCGNLTINHCGGTLTAD
jgi:hypothetical protein